MTIVDTSYLRATPKAWTAGRLKDMIKSSANGTWGEEPNGDGDDVYCVRAADFDRNRQRVSPEKLPLRSVDQSSLRRHLLKRGDIILEKSGGGDKQPVGLAVLFDLEKPAVCSNFCSRVIPRGNVDPRFLTYVFGAAYAHGLTENSINQTTGIQNLDSEFFLSTRWAYPERDEQRRIADFLDQDGYETERIQSLRRKQVSILEERFAYLVDGAVIGDTEVLERIGCSADLSEWAKTKISHRFEITPGLAFPSDKFEHQTGTRLLRGINVAPGATSWSDVVYWNERLFPVPERYQLKRGDLVIGMDRTWISSGARIAILREDDTPALLLQRVARLRTRGEDLLTYAYWLLTSTHFRAAIEADMTGVSVPHLSGDQIGGFSYLGPPLDTQAKISRFLKQQSTETHLSTSAIIREIGLLQERRRALIDALVTGQVDVSTARASSL